MKTTPNPDSNDRLASAPEGRSLRFSASLMEFLSRHPLRQGFVLGDWLETLDLDTLGHLSTLSEQVSHDPQAMPLALQDLLAVVVCAMVAERGTESLELGTGEIQCRLGLLGVAAGLEGLRRRGLVSFEGALSIDPDSAAVVRFTREGLSEGCAIAGMFGRVAQ